MISRAATVPVKPDLWGRTLSIRGKAFVAGVYEHPGRELADKTTPQIHAEVAAGALADAGLTFNDVDAYFCAGDAPGFGPMSMADYMGLKLDYVDSTELGGSSYVAHVGHAAAAIAAGKCSVALITLAGRPRNQRFMGGGARFGAAPVGGFETLFGLNVVAAYELAAPGHLNEVG